MRDLAKYKFPDPLDPGRYEGMVARANELMNRKQVAYVLGRNAPGIFEIALWMRGFENFYCDLVANQPFAEALLDIIMEVKMKYWARALELLGPNVMIISEADDLASQNRCLVSPELYRKLIKPRHTKLFSFIKKHAQVPVKIFYHSCGAITELLPDLIESGIDILNPVQVSAAGMDTKELKKRFGKDLTFYGGGVDTQHVLPHGTPQEVRDEVKRRIDDLAPGGGFIFNTVHNIQADVPPENIMAMWETVRECGVYGRAGEAKGVEVDALKDALHDSCEGMSSCGGNEGGGQPMIEHEMKNARWRQRLPVALGFCVLVCTVAHAAAATNDPWTIDFRYAPPVVADLHLPARRLAKDAGRQRRQPALRLPRQLLWVSAPGSPSACRAKPNG